jgi:hypothetical protein
MCGLKKRRVQYGMAAGAYEGETIHLRDQVAKPQCSSSFRFSWWMLWLIWPMIALIKWTVPMLVATVGSVAAAVQSMTLTISLWPLLLIGAGLWLLLRSRSDQSSDDS